LVDQIIPELLNANNGITISNSKQKNSVLNPRSTEVRRKRVERERIWGFEAETQYRGLVEKPRGCWQILTPPEPPESGSGTANGGPETTVLGTGI